MDAVRVVVLSDTHAPRRWKHCPEAVASHLRNADVVLHAGDICVPSVLEELAVYAPVYAVAGNNDGPDVDAPETLELTLAGVRIGMIHDSGPAAGRLRRMRRRFPEAQLVVFGHSHIPWDERDGEFRLLNPGSPTDRRRQPHGTIALVDLDQGAVDAVRIVPVT